MPGTLTPRKSRSLLRYLFSCAARAGEASGSIASTTRAAAVSASKALPITMSSPVACPVACLGAEPAGDVEPERLTRSHGPQAGFQVGQARVAERALPARPDVAGRSAPDSARPLSGAELRADQPT